MTEPRRSHPARRRAAGILAAALLGLATSIVVAWAFAATVVPDRADPTFARRYRDPDGRGNPEWITTARYQLTGCTKFEVSYATQIDASGAWRQRDSPDPLVIDAWAQPIVEPWAASGADWPTFEEPSRRYAVVAIEAGAFGWPLVCLYSTTTATPTPGPARYLWSRTGSFPVPHTRSPLARAMGVAGPITLPYLPIAWGIVVNTVVWGAAWWGSLVAPRRLLRWRRARRGLCRTCGYDVRATPTDQPCPECGSGRCS